MKKTVREIVENIGTSLPESLPYTALQKILKAKAAKLNVRYFYHLDRAELQGRQVILLADHACTESYVTALTGYPFVKLNVVMGKHHFYKKLLLSMFNRCGCIPKSLFEPDIKCTGKMLKIIKKGGSICLFPEGVQSSNGGTQPINPATAKFLKKLGIPVVLCKSYGAYLCLPKYDEVRRDGYQEIHYEMLFTPEDLEQLSVEEIDARLIDRFRYNDFVWNSEHKHEYKAKDGGSNAKGIDKLLYLCPRCGREFSMHVEDKDIVCECGNRIRVHDTYELEAIGNDSMLPYSNITEWHFAHRDKVREEIQNPDFEISYECDLIELYQEKLIKNPQIVTGHGTVTIDHEHMIYRGSRYEDSTELVFEIRKMPTFLSMPDKGNEFFYNGEFYLFRPCEDMRHSSKYQLVVEELHNLQDERWRKALADTQ